MFGIGLRRRSLCWELAQGAYILSQPPSQLLQVLELSVESVKH